MRIGIIGGSGLYRLGEGKSTSQTVEVETPFGRPSGPFHIEELGENTAVFLARHGEGHVILPGEINYRANVYAFKKLGVTALVSVSAVGSMKKEIRPGELVLPDQYIDWTRGGRPSTFFGSGVVGHAHFADPTCATLRGCLERAAKSLGLTVHSGGTYICIEGPQFSTRAESNLYRSWGVDVIGMTALPEAKLAREAGLSYQTVAMATDYDCWNTENEDVSVEAILKVLAANVESSRKLVFEVLSQRLPDFAALNRGGMAAAVVTAKERWPAGARETLDVILS